MGITSIFVTHDQEEAVMLADRVALLLDGVLQQYDAPRAFYERPLSMRVARFFRNENFLAGRKEGAQVMTALGILTVAASPLPDGDVMVCVRPEDITLQSSAQQNLIGARVRSSVYMGTHTQYLLDVGGSVWRIDGPSGGAFCVGEAVALHLPPERIWLLPG
jgi:ABC-type Fe3+/spermidine/putrescine transport system ATPase subunit